MKRLFALFLVGAWAGCSSPLATKSSPGPSSSALPAGIVATVGSLAVPEEVVASVAKTQQIPPRQAADAEVRDALFAAAAQRRGLEDVSEVRAALRGRLARARLEILQQQVAAAPIADAEVEEATAPHFVQLARPEAFRVIHAVVLVTEKAAPDDKAKAKVLAERIAERVAAARDADDFKTRAESIADRQGFELRIESLAPVAADGRVVDVDHPSVRRAQRPPFARAAARLTEPGQKSGVVATEFGFHVLCCSSARHRSSCISKSVARCCTTRSSPSARNAPKKSCSISCGAVLARSSSVRQIRSCRR